MYLSYAHQIICFIEFFDWFFFSHFLPISFVFNDFLGRFVLDWIRVYGCLHPITSVKFNGVSYSSWHYDQKTNSLDVANLNWPMLKDFVLLIAWKWTHITNILHLSLFQSNTISSFSFQNQYNILNKLLFTEQGIKNFELKQSSGSFEKSGEEGSSSIVWSSCCEMQCSCHQIVHFHSTNWISSHCYLKTVP